MAQVDNDLTFAAFYTLLGVPVTGLTVTATIYSETGSALVTDQACTEVAGGEYRYTLAGASVDAAGLYTAHFNTAGSVDQQRLVTGEIVDPVSAGEAPTAAAIADAVWDESASAHNTSGTTGAKLNAIGSISVSVEQTTASSGDFTVRQGVDYEQPFTLDNPPSPDPTTNTVKFSCKALGFDGETEIVCTYSSPTVTLPLTAAQTASMSVGKFYFEIRGTVSTKVRQLLTGYLTVERDA